MTTTTDMPNQPPAPDAPARSLRRVREGRVGAGVAGGLGRYFDLDPVLFRVLFATSAFFGGAGILAYLLAWAAIPEEGTERAPIDGWMAELRRRRIPVWALLAVGVVVIWAVAFSWWLPGPFFPVLVIAVLLVAFHGRRGWQSGGPTPTSPVTPPAAPSPTPDADATTPIDLTKHETPERGSDHPHGGHDRPRWVDDAYAWFRESQQASRERRRRARPVQLATAIALAVTLAVLAMIDTLGGLPMQVYFWVSMGIVGLGLLVGAVLRRYPAALTPLLVPSIIGAIAFAGSHASFSDGMGKRTWTPTGAPAAHYKLAFGQGELDLSGMRAQTTARTVRVTAAAGQIRVLLPEKANVKVEANVHIGQITVRNGASGLDSSGDGGVAVARVVPAPTGAKGAPVTVSVHLADGQIEIVRR